MSTVTQLIDDYIAMWNETDSGRRRDLIARVWTNNASYVDPVLQGDGRTGIDAMVQALQQRFPGHRFARTSEVDMHHDRVRFSWTLAPEGGAAIVEGVDFGVLAGDQLQAITGFFNQMPSAPQ
jgi:hypothetical protein